MERKGNVVGSNHVTDSVSHDSVAKVVRLCSRVVDAKGNAKAPHYYKNAMEALVDEVANNPHALEALLKMTRPSVLSS